MTVETLTGLARPEILLALPDLAGQRIAVTGASGFIGARVVDTLTGLGAEPVGCEPPHASVLDPDRLPDADWCLHLAAHKYATTAEDRPAEVADLNIRGTANVVERYGPRVVFASTCKAADPMTVYGASKLIGERIVLNAAGRVVRFVNVLGSSGSVAEIWADTPDDEPLTVTPCERMWMTPAEAVHLMLAATAVPSGRYALTVGEPEPVAHMATRLHPDRATKVAAPRRGDRVRERLVAEAEISHGSVWAPGLLEIRHPADACA